MKIDITGGEKIYSKTLGKTIDYIMIVLYYHTSSNPFEGANGSANYTWREGLIHHHIKLAGV